MWVFPVLQFPRFEYPDRSGNLVHSLMQSHGLVRMLYLYVEIEIGVKLYAFLYDFIHLPIIEI